MKVIYRLTAVVTFAAAYVPDYYFSLCTKMIEANAAVQGVCPMKGETVPYECYCGTDWWLETVYNCIETASNSSGVYERAVRESWSQLMAYCGSFGISDIPNYKQYRENAHRNPITTNYTEANSTDKPEPFSIPLEMMDEGNVIKAGIAYHRTTYVSYYYSMATLGYFFGVVLLQMCLYWFAWLVPSVSMLLFNSRGVRIFREYVGIPALFNGRAANPVPFVRWVLPRRMITLVIFGYWAIVLIFLSVDYHIQLSPYGSYSQSQLVTSAIGLRSGYLAIYLLPIVFVTAGRNNVLIYLTGWSFEIWNHFHRNLARLVVLLIIVHAIAYSIMVKNVYMTSLSAVWSEPAYKYWAPGVLSLVFMGCMLIQAVKFLREKSYEVFVVIHVLLAVGMVVATWYHLKWVGEGQKLIYAVVALWAFDGAARIARIILSGPLSRADITSHDGVTELTIKYSGLWKPRPGQHVFVHFVCPLYFWQSHPFTVMEPPEEEKDSKTLKIFAQTRNGLTKFISGHQKYNWYVWIDGPYGIEFDSRPYREVVLIAGGIGITACQTYASHIAKQERDQVLHLHWVIRDGNPLKWFAKQLKLFAIEHPNIIVKTYITDQMDSSDESSFSDQQQVYEEKFDEQLVYNEYSRAGKDLTYEKKFERPRMSDIVDEHIRNSQGSIAFFVCGPGGLSDDVRRTVAGGIPHTKNYVQFFEESFTM